MVRCVPPGDGAGDEGSPGGEHQAALPGRQQPHARLAGLGEAVGGHAGQVGGPGIQRGDVREERFGDVQVQQQPGDGDDLAAEQRAEPGAGHPEQGGREDHGAQDGEVPVAGQGDRGSPGREPRQRDSKADRDAGQRVPGAGQQVNDQLGDDDPGAARRGQETRGRGAVPELARRPGRGEDGGQRPGAAGADREQRALPGRTGQRGRRATRTLAERDGERAVPGRPRQGREQQPQPQPGGDQLAELSRYQQPQHGWPPGHEGPAALPANPLRVTGSSGGTDS